MCSFTVYSPFDSITSGVKQVAMALVPLLQYTLNLIMSSRPLLKVKTASFLPIVTNI